MSAVAVRNPPAGPGRLARHVTESAKLLTGRYGDRLDAWITAVEA